MPRPSSLRVRQSSRRRPVQHPDAELAQLTKALGHPARVRMLRLLAGQTRCSHGSLADEFPLAASTVSQHLCILRDAGLVQGEIDGPRTCYCINRERLARATALLHDLAGAQAPEIASPMPLPYCAN
jgi:ArsR family transcriptional regulator